MSLLALLEQLQADAVRVKAERPKRAARPMGDSKRADYAGSSAAPECHLHLYGDDSGMRHVPLLFEERTTGA